MPDNERVTAVIIAGGVGKDAFAESLGAAHRSLIDIGGRTILLRTVEAFLAAEDIDEVIVVGTPPVLAATPEAARKVAAAGTAAQNIEAGLNAAENESMIICTADIAWLSPAIVADFLQAAKETGADLVYPVVEKSVYEQRFGEGKRTYVTLREGTFTGGNLVFSRKGFLRSMTPLIHRLFENRKNRLALAGILGFSFVIRLLLKQANFPVLEARARELTGGKAVALPCAWAEIACDIDKPEDLAVLRRLNR